MKTVGIIAEYNPFHTGHKYQLDQIHQKLHADYIVIAMSGDFVQRGTPALFSKHVRTRMALSCGADLVVELPVSVSTASAEGFAKGAVHLLNPQIRSFLWSLPGSCSENQSHTGSFLQRT